MSDDESTEASQDWDDDDDDDSDSESGEEETFFTKKNQQRVQESGGWFSYLKQYMIFWPYLWPSQDLKFTLYVVVLVVNILLERALNILQPRQFGIVVDKLYNVQNTGEFPWRAILLWGFFTLLVSSESGVKSINEALQMRISKWSHLRLSVAAFDHVMSLDMNFQDSKDSGELIKAVEQAGALNGLLSTLLLECAPFVLDVAIALWYVTYLLDIYAAILILYVIVAFVFASYRIGTKM